MRMHHTEEQRTALVELVTTGQATPCAAAVDEGDRPGRPVPRRLQVVARAGSTDRMPAQPLWPVAAPVATSRSCWPPTSWPAARCSCGCLRAERARRSPWRGPSAGVAARGLRWPFRRRTRLSCRGQRRPTVVTLVVAVAIAVALWLRSWRQSRSPAARRKPRRRDLRRGDVQEASVELGFAWEDAQPTPLAEKKCNSRLRDASASVLGHHGE